MTKRQIIDEILTLNRSAEPGFLARFDDSDLGDYLQHLRLAQTPRLTGDASRYDKYFVTTAAPRFRKSFVQTPEPQSVGAPAIQPALTSPADDEGDDVDLDLLDIRPADARQFAAAQASMTSSDADQCQDTWLF
jgi:hypothetical protein